MAARPGRGHRRSRNVGALLLAAGLGWDGVLLAPRAADPLPPRDQGEHGHQMFSLPWARVDDWATAIPTLQAAGFAAALARPDLPWPTWTTGAPAASDRLCLVVGTGAGLSQR